MTAEMLGRLLGSLLVPLLVMAIVAAVYRRVSRPRLSFREAILRWWVLGLGLVIFLLAACGQLVNSFAAARS